MCIRDRKEELDKLKLKTKRSTGKAEEDFA